MAHNHSVADNDTQFIVDSETMKIYCDSNVKALKRGDHLAEKYGFIMPRFIEDHDMSLCNKVEVHFNNSKYDNSTRTETVNKSFDEVLDFGISETDENSVVWTWFVSSDATQLDGTLDFCIRFACMDGEKIEYQKFTEIYEGITVGETIWNTEEVAKQHADVLEKWRQELLAAVENGGGVGDISEVVEEALAQAKESGEFDGKDGLSTYAIWLQQGNTGTKADFLASLKGKDGKSVTVSSVTESTADGGENVVAFSDGNVLKVKNGSKGSKGDPGYTPQKRVDYFTESDKAELVSEVLENFVDVSEVAL